MFQARDFILTQEGLAFAVTLGGIEDGRIIGCLRYVQDSQGKWLKLSTAQAEALLRQRYPHYLYYSPRRDALLHAVPQTAVAAHLQPRSRLQTLICHPSSAPLIARLKSLVAWLEATGVSRQDLGITGSLLLGNASANSDLDLVVYGREAFSRAREAVRKGLALKQLEELDDALWQASYLRRGCALSLAEYRWHEQRKYNKGALGGTKFDLILVEETSSELDLKAWRKIGRAKVRAKVLDATWAFSTPARYLLDHPIRWAVSFSATYVGQAEAGEQVEVAGYLEQAEDGAQQIVVGSSREAPGEYIKVIQPKRGALCYRF